ncbi:MAG: V-type ATP synthase subunit E [Phycisphaerales bacterium]|nr:MAG: V-type ATP synthase subunit E [Phycisphaerales bacterium]
MQDDIRQLLAAIRETADAEMADVRAQAEQEIAKISERTETQVRQLRETALAQLEEQLSAESERIVGRAELDIRDRLVLEKNKALEEVFELARKELASLDDSGTNQEVLRRLIQEAMGKINSEDVRLRISRDDLALWESLKADFPTLESATPCDGPRGTVIVETCDGTQSIDNSIETRLETAREVMRRELIELLFGDETAGEEGI